MEVPTLSLTGQASQVLTSESAPLSAPGHVKETYSWHRLWTTKLHTATENTNAVIKVKKMTWDIRMVCCSKMYTLCNKSQNVLPSSEPPISLKGHEIRSLKVRLIWHIKAITTRRKSKCTLGQSATEVRVTYSPLGSGNASLVFLKQVTFKKLGVTHNTGLHISRISAGLYETIPTNLFAPL